MRPASEVAHDVCEEMEEYGPYFAVKAIEADRAEARAELVAEIVQYLHQLDATRDRSNLIGWAANRVQAEFGGRDG